MTESEQTVVLVADDEPSTLALVTAHVRAKGYKVIEASDGDMAWQLAHQHLPHLVILDVMMPGMSGWEVCRKIREALPLAHTGVIMLTGIGENLNEMTSPLYGADAHIDKPFEFGDLDDMIKEVLALRSSGKFGRTDDADVEHDEEAVDELAGIPSLMPSADLDDLDFSDDERELPLDSLPPPPRVAKFEKKPAKAAKKPAPAKVASKPAKPAAVAPKAKAATKPVKGGKVAAAPVKQTAAKAVKQTALKATTKATAKKAAKQAVKQPAAKKASKKTAKPVTSKKVAKKAPVKKSTAKKAAKKSAKVAQKPAKSVVKNAKLSKATLGKAALKPAAKKASKKKSTKR